MFLILSVTEWLSLIPFVGTVSFIAYATAKACVPPILEFTRPSHAINASVRKDEKKVVDFLEVEDLASEKIAFCRCWKSKNVSDCEI